MINREKVIKGLECCSAVPEHDCENCPYNQETGDYICGSREMKHEAIALLKEQEAVPYEEHDTYHCGNCDDEIVGWEDPTTGESIRFPFCRRCGKKIAWDKMED